MFFANSTDHQLKSDYQHQKMLEDLIMLLGEHTMNHEQHSESQSVNKSIVHKMISEAIQGSSMMYELTNMLTNVVMALLPMASEKMKISHLMEHLIHNNKTNNVIPYWMKLSQDAQTKNVENECSMNKCDLSNTYSLKEFMEKEKIAKQRCEQNKRVAENKACEVENNDKIETEDNLLLKFLLNF